MKFAYADPPYPGQEARYEGPGVNHPLLIAHLVNDFDGWALSTSSPSLRDLLPLCPPDTRVASWSKPWASVKPGQRIIYSWEPVLFWTPRRSTNRANSVRDSIRASVNQNGFHGSKPHEFTMWVFGLLGIELADEFTDLFHGSGAVQEAADMYARQRRLDGGQLRPREMKRDQLAYEVG